MKQQSNTITKLLLSSLSAIYFFAFLLPFLNNMSNPPLPNYNNTGGSVQNGNTMSDDIYKIAFIILFLILWYFTVRAFVERRAWLWFIVSIPFLAAGFEMVGFFLYFGK